MRATPAALCRWSACELLPARTAVHAALVGHAPLCDARCCCGAAFLACGRLSSRPWSPLPTALRSTQSPRCPQWSMPPGLPCRRSRRQSNTIPNATGVPIAIRRQDWWRGPQDCALHLKPLPPVEHAARLAMSAVAPAEQHNPERCGMSKRHPARTTARSTSSRRPKWSKPPGLPCRRSRRQTNTHPSCTGVPSANRPARLRAPPQAAAPVEHAARLAMPAVTPAEQHNPEPYGSFQRHRPPRLAAWPARLRAPPQAAAPARWSKPPGLPCRRSRRQSNTIPNATGVPIAIRRQDWWRGPQDCALHLKPPPPVEQAARLAMPAVAPAEPHNPELCGSSKRHPPPRLAPWHARLRAPLRGSAGRGCTGGGIWEILRRNLTYHRERRRRSSPTSKN